MLKWFMDWCVANCKKNHLYLCDIKIYTLNLPGWAVEIKLPDTFLIDKKIKPIPIRNDSNWINCDVFDNTFKGRGDQKKLEEILTVFKTWIESQQNMNLVNWLAKYYILSICENQKCLSSVSINTLDNPGWCVEIDLSGSKLANSKFDEFQNDNGDDDWIHCRIEKNVFKAFGDANKLEEIIKIFKKLVEDYQHTNILNWLMDWYESNCDGFWEHMYGVKIDTLDNPGWAIQIDLTDTLLEDKKFEKIQIDNGDDDWIICRIENNIFRGDGDTHKLIKILEIFKNWVEIEQAL